MYLHSVVAKTLGYKSLLPMDCDYISLDAFLLLEVFVRGFRLQYVYQSSSSQQVFGPSWNEPIRHTLQPSNKF